MMIKSSGLRQCEIRDSALNAISQYGLNETIKLIEQQACFEIKTATELSYLNFKIQSMDFFKNFNSDAQFTINLASAYFSKYFTETNWKIFWGRIQDLGIVYTRLSKSNNYDDYKEAAIIFIRLAYNDHLTNIDIMGYLDKLIKEIFEYIPQSNLDYINLIKQYLDKYDEFKDSKLMIKVHKFIMYMLSLSIFDALGINFNTFNYSKMEQEALKKKFFMGPDFVKTVIDLCIFIIERGTVCMRTGSLDPFLHNSNEYVNWYDKSNELIDKAAYITDPEPMNIDIHKFRSEIRDTIEHGLNLLKYSKEMVPFERKSLATNLSKLQLIERNDLTRRNAMRDRKSPFALLLYGGSSVGKSVLSELFYKHYAKVFNLEDSAEYKYTRNACDEYWVNFNSSQWYILLDDIAYKNPNKSNDIDETLKELIRIQNNVAYVVTQADLESKGRTPMQAKLLLATTNVEHLNAASYFACPYAVSRRLPFVLEVIPKKEFSKDEACKELDSSKIPELPEGHYPNYWNFILKEPKLRKNGLTDQAELVVKQHFNNIYDLIGWYNQAIMNHDNIQTKVMSANDNLSKVVICNDCKLPSVVCQCVQSNDTIVMENFIYDNWYSYYINYIWWIFTAFVLSFFTRTINLENCLIKNLNRIVTRFALKCMGYRLKCNLYNFNYRQSKVIKIATSVLALGSTYIVLKKLYDHFRKKESVSKQTDEQIRSQDIGVSPTPLNEVKKNVWYKDDYDLTTFDISRQTSSYNSLSLTQIDTILSRNVVHIKCLETERGKEYARYGISFCIGGHLYVTNNHNIPNIDSIEIELVMGTSKDGINTNKIIMLSNKEIYRLPEKDLCFFEINDIPPKKKLIDLFCKKDLNVKFNGRYISRNRNGFIEKWDLINLHKVNKYVDSLGADLTMWRSFISNGRPTKTGDCGSLCYTMTGHGPIILGVHCLLNTCTGHVLATEISQETINDAIHHFGSFIVDSNSPNLCAQGYERNLNELHYKSPVRFIENGSANVYGSFDGFRPNTKSRVTKTFIYKSLVARGYKCDKWQPVMDGWEPKRRGLIDMVNLPHQIDSSILNLCVDSFTEDILNNISDDELKILQVYDDFTALNGAAGIEYVDKINRSTSAGNPFKKSKKFFLHAIPPQGDNLEPVALDDIIQQRVDDCVQAYKAGKRYMPNFCAHFKDEPTSKKKIDIKKTRIFTGAPFEFSFVVRKYLLSSIRLIQRNRYAFEAGPGTICQSLEWQELYHYLTQHGEDRMVAGDYSAFDKSMPAPVILAAFRVLINIHKAAGWSKDDLQVLQCIAEDTAFPLVDFFGDLIEFYGSNPSGHPLTVIINSLANSIYMRYAYYVNNPKRECISFKKNVSLMTYGDDNIMGVSRKINFFHHTAIVDAMRNIGIKYTMADKETVSVPFIDIKNTSFLKRSFRFDDDIKCWMCPIEHDSIHKMLLVCVKSKTISEQQQAVAVISSAIREYFYYGKRIFDIKRDMFKSVIDENQLNRFCDHSTLPTWDELVTQFHENSKHVNVKKYSWENPSKRWFFF